MTLRGMCTANGCLPEGCGPGMPGPYKTTAKKGHRPLRAGVPASYAILRLLKAHALHEPDKGGLTGGVLLKDTGILQNMAEHGADLGLDGLVGVLRLHVGAVLCNQLVDPVGMDGQRVARFAAGVRALPGQNFRDLRA
mgnify:CR=1 FL=1